jgi:transcriptional regulator with XRE-family HTH domain
MTETQRRIARARLLRRDGKTYDEIRAVVGPVSDDRLQTWLAGIPRPASTWRGRAKDDLRRECRRLRAEGLTYHEIAARTGASQGSLSVWLRDQRGPNVKRVDQAEHIRRIQPKAVAAHKANAEARRDTARQRGAAAVGEISDRDLFIAGVALYWAEGVKDKPWRRSGRVVLINGDADALRLFLAWLDLVGVPEEDRIYRLNIHESADVPTHERWWADALGLPLASFARATLKRHKPVTVRRNVGDSYHGCLVVSVRRSAALYDEIEGAWRRIVGDALVNHGE